MSAVDGYWGRHGEPGYWGDITRHFDPGAALLDLGCGTGWMAEHFKDYTGVEIGVDAVSAAVDLGRNVRLADLVDPLPFADGSFDAVVVKDVLEHVVEPLAVVREIRRVLRPAGRVYACAPDAQRWMWEDWSHRRPFPVKALRRLFTDSGFELIDSGYETVVPGSSIVSARTRSHRRPLPLRVLGRVPLVRRNAWVLVTAG